MNELNDESMKTVVETFLIEETVDLIHDGEKLSQWNDLVEELELAGQTEIVKPDKSPIPFMHMKNTLINVFETLCPRKVEVAQYNVTPIPVEILGLVSLSKKEGYFNKIEIWYDDVKPDPACIGLTGCWYEMNFYNDRKKSLEGKEFSSKEDVITAGGKHPSFRETAKYLIGKWADVKHSIDELTEMAKGRYVKSKGAEYRKKIKEAQRSLDDLEAEAEERFEIGPINTFF